MSDDRRRLVLLYAVIEQRGEWTTRRVQRLYRQLGYAAPLRRIARRDLAQLAREGVLVLDDTVPTRRFYTAKDAA